jgi:hypothetical protein
MLDLNELNYFHEDLDKDKPFKFTKVLEYDDSHVDHKPLKDIHIRGSSRKEVI